MPPFHLSFDWRPGDQAVVHASFEASGPHATTAEEQWELTMHEVSPGTLELRVADLDGRPALPDAWTPGWLLVGADGRLRPPVDGAQRASASLWWTWVDRWIGTDRRVGETRTDRLSLASPVLGWRPVPTTLEDGVDGVHRCAPRRRTRCVELGLTVVPDESAVSASFAALRAAFPEVGAATVDRAVAAEAWSIATEIDTLRPQAVIGTRTIVVVTSDGGRATREETVRYSFAWRAR